MVIGDYEPTSAKQKPSQLVVSMMQTAIADVVSRVDGVYRGVEAHQFYIIDSKGERIWWQWELFRTDEPVEFNRENVRIRNAREDFEKLGAVVIDHGDPRQQWGALFLLSGETTNNPDLILDASLEMDSGVIEILHRHNLMYEWIDAGTIGIYPEE